MLNKTNIRFFKQAVPGPYRENELDIAAKCPICGDSKYRKSSKRLHLFHKAGNDFVKCFNGDCVLETTTNLYNFLKNYYPSLLEFYKKETYFQKIENLKETKNTETTLISCFDTTIQNNQTIQNSTIVDLNNTKVDFSNIKNSDNTSKLEKTNSINDKALKIRDLLTFKEMNIFHLKEKIIYSIEPINDKTKTFLLKRGLNPNHLMEVFGKFYSGRAEFLFNSKYYDLKDTLFIPIEYNKELTGFYARKLDEKRFINYGASIPYNLNNIDNTKPVYIFEAILDALSFYTLYNEKNIIALSTNKINPKVLDFINNPVFCLDNDKTGLKTMLSYTYNKKARFLIYPKDLIYKDFNEMLLNNFKLDLNLKDGFSANIELRKLIA